MTSPLDGIKVVEITSIYSGPFAGMMLAELGADVVKVEGPDGPDPVRAMGLGSGPDAVNSTFYALNRGKRFVSLDAKTERGRALLGNLAAGADVFLHNMRPGKAETLGVGYEALAERNPGLVYVAISGFGNDGPEADLPVYDYVVQAKVGMVDYQRDLDSGRSDLVHQVVVDKTAANAAVQGVLAALLVRERTGRGQRVDVPMISVGAAFLWPDGMAAFHAEVSPAMPPSALPAYLTAMPSTVLVVLATTDGEIATGLLLPPWDGLCLALDRVDLVTDSRFADQTSRVLNFPALKAEIAAEVAKYSTADVLERFARFDFAAGPVVPRTEVHLDPTVQHLGVLGEQRVAGIGRVRQPGPQWSFAADPARVTTSIGRTGEHTREVLAERTGLSAGDIAALVADGVVKEP